MAASYPGLTLSSTRPYTACMALSFQVSGAGFLVSRPRVAAPSPFTLHPSLVWWGFCLLLLVVDLTACTQKESTYPADYARYQRIDKALETLQQAYVLKDQKTVNSIRLPLEDLDRMELEMVKDFETYADIKTEFSIERILIEGNTIETYVHWVGQWKKTPLDDGIRERGHGMLRWVGVQSILLSSLEGDLPFGMATRQASAKIPEPPKPETP